MTYIKKDQMEIIKVAGAKSRLSELIGRPASGEPFIIKRRQCPVAAIISTAEVELAALKLSLEIR